MVQGIPLGRHVAATFVQFSFGSGACRFSQAEASSAIPVSDPISSKPSSDDLAPVVSVEALGLTLGGIPVLAGVSFRASKGMVILVGPNGAGKSSLLRVLATLYQPTTGRVMVAGHNVGSRRAIARARRRLGYLPQRPDFPGRFTGAEAVGFAAWLADLPRDSRDLAVNNALIRFDAGHLAQRPLAHMSVGERQRIYLAQATVQTPSVLLLDEPTGALDPEHRGAIRELVRDWSNGSLAIMATHSADEIAHLGTRVLVLVGGHVRFDGSSLELAAIGRSIVRDDAPASLAIEAALRELRIASERGNGEAS